MARAAVFLLALALPAFCQRATSIDELVSFIKSAIQMNQHDRQVADAVSKLKLSNRLESSTVVELQRLGAGQKTVAALEQLSKASTNLPAATQAPQRTPAVTPPPGAEEQKAILAEIRENALSYTRNLPNYICIQKTAQHIDPTGAGNYQRSGTVTEQLSFFEQHETYKVLYLNDKFVDNMKHEQVPGAKSSGEFGSILREIFEPQTGTDFQWEKWGRLNGRVMYVFAYRVTQPLYGIFHDPSKRSVHVGYHGLVYADRDTRAVMRLELECDGIPSDFPIESVKLELNYDYAEISGQKFLLPARSEVRSKEGRLLSWNETDYMHYSKFGSDVKITFDTPTEDTPPPKKK